MVKDYMDRAFINFGGDKVIRGLDHITSRDTADTEDNTLVAA